MSMSMSSSSSSSARRPVLGRNEGGDDDDDDVLDRAHQAAHHMSLSWIRSVFREVCYQLWKKHWRVEHVEVSNVDNEDGNDDPSKSNDDNDNRNASSSSMHCRLHLTAAMIQQAQATCQRVADRWCQRLDAQGHKEFANWVQHVVKEEMGTCFFPQEQQQTKSHQSRRNARSNDSTDDIQEDDDQSSTMAQEKKKAPNSSEVDHGDDNDDNTNSDTVTTTCTLATLRNLSIPHNKLTEENYQYLIAKLDEMGYARKTYWPYDWHIIQKAAQQIPERMYNRESSDLQLQLVPKAQPPQHQKQQQQPDHPDMPPPNPRTTTTAAAVQQDVGISQDNNKDWTKEVVALGRTRRIQQVSYDKEGTQSSNKKRKTTQDHNPPRPPQTMGQCQIPYHQVAAMASPELDACLHPEDQRTVVTPNNTLLGALKPLGHVHHSIQSQHDGVRSSTMRGRKLQLGRSVRARYGTHQEEKSFRSSRWSKVARTIPAAAEATRKNDNVGYGSGDAEEHYLDLDLGECFVDLQDDDDDDDKQDDVNNSNSNGTRRLYAFSSLELFLLDEDETGENSDGGEDDDGDNDSDGCKFINSDDKQDDERRTNDVVDSDEMNSKTDGGGGVDLSTGVESVAV